jgi:D-alanyl-D-alanine dipeptidase
MAGLAKNTALSFIFLTFFISTVLPDPTGTFHEASKSNSPAGSLKMLEHNPDYVDLSTLPDVVISLKYATIDNFMGINMYGAFNKAFLHQDAATKFKKAIELLKKEKPGWSFIIFDALRPHSVQWVMWNRVKDTPQRKYVANAEIGSPHNYGMALDLSLLDEKGKEIDMGTGFDSFSEVSEPQLEEKFLKEGKLTRRQMDNRLILRKVMTDAGFIQLSHEWWHYNALPEPEIRRKYKIVE